jgi:hypothetical protein
MPKLLTAALLLVLSGPALAETHTFGAFIVDDAHPTVAVLNGPIAHHTPLDFRRVVDAFPVQTLGLNSTGGDVSAGLILALEVHDMAIDTVISSDAGCYSACAYVFLAGSSRQVDGEIGVHMPSPIETRVLTELDIRFVLAKFDVPIWIYDGILNMPHDDIRVFDAAEAAKIGLNR